MALFTRSRLFGILLIAASLPMDPGVGRALAASGSAPPASQQPEPAPADAIEARLRRIAAAVRDQQGDEADLDELSADGPQARVFVNGPRIGFGNGGFRNGGFHNGGFRNGGFYNGGFRNGGFGNGGFRNGGWRNYW
ncbi:rSAM-associated Gly-rich repeat protein [Synechococcus sp. CS-1329]|jgi:rSAM-associated Gly-rich repeat protein|uniref:GrrA/OscA1 family cyclophane-containing rSAM-modified RiPP n=1 Tax=Synechococcus sp. CS-1329 TaxID=2847975 RepID=UPI00223B0495|nr:GrrA/OscA1 family cyclophane-containing rSAM-modified RiPP [Synechococcus sp. CS-1329]MCT0218999.1 rSAM-associated Gly-rich repeat protein [Synechococcus sp. CS-1329]